MCQIKFFYSPDRDVQCLLKQLQSLVVRNAVMHRTFLNNDSTIKLFQLVAPESPRRFLWRRCALRHCVLHDRSTKTKRKCLSTDTGQPSGVILESFSRVAACAWSIYYSGLLPRNAELRPSGGRLGAPTQHLCVHLIGPLPVSNDYRYCLTADQRPIFKNTLFGNGFAASQL